MSFDSSSAKHGPTESCLVSQEKRVIKIYKEQKQEMLVETP